MTTSCSLLLVEDDPELLQILQRALARRGLHVCACQTPEEALQLAGDTVFHAAVIDGNLGDQDGTVLVRQLRELQPQLRAIVLSGRADRAARDSALQAGACEYLQKPCALGDLHAAIVAAVGGENGQPRQDGCNSCTAS